MGGPTAWLLLLIAGATGALSRRAATPASVGLQDVTVLLQTVVDLDSIDFEVASASAASNAAADQPVEQPAGMRIVPPLQSGSVYQQDFPSDDQEVYTPAPSPVPSGTSKPGGAGGQATTNPVKVQTHNNALYGEGLPEPYEGDSIQPPPRKEVKGDSQYAHPGRHDHAETPEQIAKYHVSFVHDWVGMQPDGGFHLHGYITLCWLITCLVVGCILTIIETRFIRPVMVMPHTIMLFLAGCVMACFLALWRSGPTRPDPHEQPLMWPVWFNSANIWDTAQPALLFYIFLPVIVFAEAMKLNISIAKAVCVQVILLAFPGLYLCVAPVALLTHHVIPYDWSWPTCWVFGAILSAIDPAFVVNLFKSLGVSQRLVIMVSLESLLSAGHAIILFALFFRLMLGATVTAGGGVLLVLEMVCIPLLLGSGFAFLMLIVVSCCSETHYSSDKTVQVVLTICTAFCCFFLAENSFNTSGVLTVVCAGCIFAYVAWPRFVSREVVRIVWEALRYVATTVIFTLAGLLWGLRVLERRDMLGWADVGWLLLLYFTCMLSRVLMVFLFRPILNLVGQSVTWEEGAAIAWSGMHGVMGLILAIVMDRQVIVDVRIGTKVLFHVGGLALLSFVNAFTMPMLLRFLGLSGLPEIEEVVRNHMDSLIRERVKECLEDIIATKRDRRFVGANPETVMMLLPHLSTEERPQLHRSIDSGTKLRVCRETFMQAVQARYWSNIDSGLIPRSSRPARVLVYSTDVGIHSSQEPLHDWDVIADHLHRRQAFPTMNGICATWPLSLIAPLQHLFPSSDMVRTWQTYAAVCYLEAHKSAWTELQRNFGTDSVLGQEVQTQVAQESGQQCEKATAMVHGLPQRSVEVGKRRMLSGWLLQVQMEKTQELNKIGVLTDAGADEMIRGIYQSKRRVVEQDMFAG